MSACAGVFLIGAAGFAAGCVVGAIVTILLAGWRYAKEIDEGGIS